VNGDAIYCVAVRRWTSGSASGRWP